MLVVLLLAVTTVLVADSGVSDRRDFSPAPPLRGDGTAVEDDVADAK